MRKKYKLVLILMCLVVFAAMAMGSGTDTSVDNSNAKDVTEGANGSDNNVVMVGGSFEKGGLKCTVTDADASYTDYDDPYGLYAPHEGKKYIKVDMTFENNGKSDAYVSPYEFDCYADNQTCEQNYLLAAGDFTGGNISAGRQTSFSVIFEVPENSQSIEVEYTANVWTSEKIIIKVQ